jgi:hypothetical protein
LRQFEERVRSIDGSQLSAQQERRLDDLIVTSRRARLSVAARTESVSDRDGWQMVAEPRSGKLPDSPPRVKAFYRGYRDTGYRISTGGKRTLSGWQAPRRPKVGHHFDYTITGQVVRPTDLVWCPACGTLNQLDWPEALRDCET